MKPKSVVPLSLESYFEPFRENCIGFNTHFDTVYGSQHLIYADWIASGRLYKPIEERLLTQIGPLVANTHTETSYTGSVMTFAYHEAIHKIKKHVGAYETDVLISAGSGMTAVVNKLQRMLGLRVHERYAERIQLDEHERPVVFITHMEHHSNQTSWLETIADVVIINPDSDGLVDLEHFATLLEMYKTRPLKIAAITSCSNVTGLFTPYHDMARMIHEYNGYCFVDFACSAPYINIDMHPEDPMEHLDAIYFSPHKFLGGPGSSGIMIFDPKLYTNKIPDNPGGGTVEWTNPWGEHKYIDDIQAREDGGTPGFLQTIKAALAIQLKEQMKPELMLEREHELLNLVWDELESIPNLHILAGDLKERLAILSFYVDSIHYNLMVKILNDRFGIQVRGGCSCAGTYGHYLLHVRPEYSKMITNEIDKGNRSLKPGWIRLSLHPIMTDEEALFCVRAIRSTVENIDLWKLDYLYDEKKNEFFHKNEAPSAQIKAKEWIHSSL